jgi:hypothetical protein
VGPSSGAQLRPSTDVRFTADFDIDVSVLRATSRCPAATDAGVPTFRHCTESTFAGEKSSHSAQNSVLSGQYGPQLPTGTSCVAASDDPRRPDACDRLHVTAGTVVRFQRVVETNYMMGSEFHAVRVLRSCATPCEADETRCASSTTCFKSGGSFCELCEGLDEAVCACRNGCGLQPEGQECAFDTSDDTVQEGTCKAGTCK